MEIVITSKKCQHQNTIFWKDFYQQTNPLFLVVYHSVYHSLPLHLPLGNVDNNSIGVMVKIRNFEELVLKKF